MFALIALFAAFLYNLLVKGPLTIDKASFALLRFLPVFITALAEPPVNISLINPKAVHPACSQDGFLYSS
jgi:hypothetical protein